MDLDFIGSGSCVFLSPSHSGRQTDRQVGWVTFRRRTPQTRHSSASSDTCSLCYTNRCFPVLLLTDLSSGLQPSFTPSFVPFGFSSSQLKVKPDPLGDTVEAEGQVNPLPQG